MRFNDRQVPQLMTSNRYLKAVHHYHELQCRHYQQELAAPFTIFMHTSQKMTNRRK
ncbi:hypothetical protein [Gracilibacillus alcaliphilus]|uniref:hypothetical protein n=1 Tax=Gracilibacillus alcaliphilus TaxID=1401441 RepID=UPI00195E67B6|nr:hypothetical protein [Gracilibacillus alcaliphilus]MBM7678593.1 hypothetical protein [Gracilibacillus alcaliphilus]